MFVDPWGYRGLSLQLIQAVLKDWGCECIFFFNYNRINMGVANDLVQPHMEAIFGGPEPAAALRQQLEGLTPPERELAIIEAVTTGLKRIGARLVLPFRFRDENGSRTSHHLVFTTKDFRGYEIMKEVMASASSTLDDGVPSFEYSPADARFPSLFNLSRPVEDLGEMLLDTFAGKTLQMLQLYKIHSIGRPFLKKNYKEAFARLEAEGRVTADPPAAERRAGTFADGVFVSFPERR